ncbi:MAG: prolyl oligopeptidase family serine peptidase [Hyphomicrobiaceae bacterium]|nr:prolyl oligopeptidase family serine peptidase [Hyphomicrobiaceae bacterium]
MRRIVRATMLLALALVFGASARAEEYSIKTRDGLRGAIVLPAERPRAPTVIVLHGALVSAEFTLSWYGFVEEGVRHRFATVFPRGIDLLWNDGRNAVWTSAADDVGFLRRLVRALIARGVADPARIYIAGVSNGGMLALRMVCEAPELFAGAGVIIASMPTDVGGICHLRQPMPIIMFNGTDDPLIPYGGGAVGLTSWQGTVWPVERTAAFLARGNGCGPPTKAVFARGADSGTSRVVRLDWAHCSSEHGVTLYRVEGGGHQVYGHTNFFPLFLGSGTSLVSAPEVIMAAFAGNGRPPSR